jgi:GNAT superfamily N-acetyltransferase
MTVKLRPGTQADAQLCGTICFEAFKAIGGEHNFPSGFPSPEFARRLLSRMLAHPQVYCVVAELDSRVVGSNFVDERSCIYGVGPITVDPAVQNGGIGRQLMEDVIGRATQRKACGMRLLQAGFHNRSLALYAKLGFRAREMVSVLQGAPLQQRIVGYEVRLATLVDVPACNRICHRVHGYDREVELREAIEGKTASVVEHLGHVTGYTTGIAQLAHTVGEANARWLEARLSDDTHDNGPLQRAKWCIPAVHSVLSRPVNDRLRS